jgi:hypothetical protein
MMMSFIAEWGVTNGSPEANGMVGGTIPSEERREP